MKWCLVRGKDRKGSCPRVDFGTVLIADMVPRKHVVPFLERTWRRQLFRHGKSKWFL